ncbi:hypothetical protein DV738_g1800, partial [Chaetothyriales sp. CBS 135597]
MMLSSVEKKANFQKIGAFKPRGAFHATVRLIETLGLEEVRRRGVVTHSSGNHAQALALAAKTFDIPAYIVMPRISTPSKIAGTRAYTSHVIFSGSTSVEREEVVAKVQAETGAILVPPYDHPDIVLGQGTVALEMDEQLRESPATKVFGAEPSFQGADDAGRGVAQGERIEAVKSLTIADGLRTPVGIVNWGIVSDKTKVEGFYSVTEEQITMAMRLVFERMKLVVEPIKNEASSSPTWTTAVHRYYIDVRGLTPAGRKDPVHLPLLSTLPPELQQSIQKYLRPADRLMSLSSALLKYYFIHTQARIPWDEAKLDEWIDIFGEMFSAQCRDEIRTAPPPARLSGGSSGGLDLAAATIQSRLRRFYAFWALKEAYIKMVGEGLLADWLTKLEFEHADGTDGLGWALRTPEELKWTPAKLAVRDIRAVLDGRPVEDVQLALVAYEDDFLFATAMRGLVEYAGAGASAGAGHTVAMIQQQTTGPTGAGAEAIAVQADVSVEADCKRVVDTALARLGRVDILCNIVGVGGPPGNAVDVDMAQWARGMEVNVASMVMMANLLYPTSKGAVVNMTRAMAVHHAKDGIRVNCVCPGMVYTPMMYGAGGGMSAEAREARKNRSLLQVEGNGWDVGASVRFLAGDESRWITGECLVVDAGTTSATSTQIPSSGTVGQQEKRS